MSSTVISTTLGAGAEGAARPDARPESVGAATVGAGTPGPVEVALLWFVYRSAADGTGGSLGKRLLKLSIVGTDGSRPGLASGAARNLWSLSSLLVLVVGPTIGNALAVGVSVAVGISIARHPAELGWHDRVAGTAVRRPS